MNAIEIARKFSEIKADNKDLVLHLMVTAKRNQQTVYGELLDWLRDMCSELSLMEREILCKMLLGDFVIHNPAFLLDING